MVCWHRRLLAKVLGICVEKGACKMPVGTNTSYLKIFIVSSLVITVTFTIFSLNVWPFASPKPPACEEYKKIYKDISVFDLDLVGQRAALMCDAAKEDQWYARQAVSSQFVNSLGTIAIILLTLATSFLLGSGWTDNSPSVKVISIALPLVSAAIAASLSQFGLQDATQLREFGRIEARKIYFEAMMLSIDNANLKEDIIKVRDKLSNLEYDQATKYYSFRYSDSSKD